jgi:hypothetical protein
MTRAKQTTKKVSKRAARIALNQRNAMTPEAVKQYEKIANPIAVDSKSAAANDKSETTEFANPVGAPITVPASGYVKGNRTRAANKAKAPAEKPAPKTPTEVGANRKEGLRLWVLAGKPKPADFIAVYGPKGPAMTWDQRAEKGIPADKFQEALAAAHALTTVGEKKAPAAVVAPEAVTTAVPTTRRAKAARKGR